MNQHQSHTSETSLLSVRSVVRYLLLSVPVLLALTASQLVNPRPFSEQSNHAVVAALSDASPVTDKDAAGQQPQKLTEEHLSHFQPLNSGGVVHQNPDQATLAIAWRFGDTVQGKGVALEPASQLIHFEEKQSVGVKATFKDAAVLPSSYSQRVTEEIDSSTSGQAQLKHVSDQDATFEDLPSTDAVEDQTQPQTYALQFPASENVDVSIKDSLITLNAQNASLSSILNLLSKQLNLNLICSDVGDERVNVKIANVSLTNALNSILPIHGYTYVVQNNIIVVTKVDPEKPMHSSLQGKQIRVFDLNYVSGTEVLRIVTKLLSPIGSAFVNQAMPDNKLQSHEQIVVEDMPPYLMQVEEYIAQADVAPKQVQVEAHILQIALTDNCRHGVDFNQLLRVANSSVTLQSAGFATTSPAPTSVFRLNGTDLTSVIDVLQSTTDTKTLASPKVTVINGQKSRMQVGGKIGYLMTTTTQTSSLQSVNFLEYGVILLVTPLITAEGDILMNVAPQVSTGRVNSTTNLPESELTQVETTVMLKSGEAIIIGGLIKENDSETQNKIPILGDIWLVGRIFQKRSHQRERSEVVITLLPRIVSEFTPDCDPDASQIDQSLTPLMHGALHSNDRTMWEPELPDAMRRD